MADKRIFHVNYSLNGWRAQLEQSDRIVCEGQRKSEVINCIREKAKREGDAKIIIHNREGKIIDETDSEENKDISED